MMSELLSYFSHNPDNDSINSLLKSTYPEQIKHFVFLSLFLTRLSGFTPFGVGDDGEELEEEEREEGKEEGEDGKRRVGNKES
jgi:hypothetical protein